MQENNTVVTTPHNVLTPKEAKQLCGGLSKVHDKRQHKEEFLKQMRGLLQQTLRRAERGKLFNATDESIANVCIVLLGLIEIELNEIAEHGEA